MERRLCEISAAVPTDGIIVGRDKEEQCEACVPEQPIHMLCALAAPLQRRATGAWEERVEHSGLNTSAGEEKEDALGSRAPGHSKTRVQQPEKEGCRIHTLGNRAPGHVKQGTKSTGRLTSTTTDREGSKATDGRLPKKGCGEETSAVDSNEERCAGWHQPKASCDMVSHRAVQIEVTLQ